ncbi:MAG: histidine ammonia-lyase [Actinomycetia bacterium]|nr:histidine ammonia-lyase [Actinomycetes bacterium]
MAGVIDGSTLGVSEVVQFARFPDTPTPSISPEARKRVTATRDLRRQLVAQGEPIYGVTTGFGGSADHHIAPEDARDLQTGLLAFLGAGTGPEAPDEVVRATMLIRSNCLARGHSGVRPEVPETLLALLEHDILPVVPVRGSCGASGDLIPLASIASALCGTGMVRVRGQRVEAADAMDSVGLTALVLEAKEGLALTNGTSFMSAWACLAIADGELLVHLAEVCTALAVMGTAGNPNHFHPFIHEQKGHPGQRDSAAQILRLLGGADNDAWTQADPSPSPGEVDRRARLVQDRYSLRCAPHVIGVLRDTLTIARQWIEREINATDDNPLFDAAAGMVHSGGNFYGGHIGQAMDSLKVAVASVADLLDRQLALLVDDRFSHGLPVNLSGATSGMHHGFKGMQLACSAVTAEALKVASSPATLFSRSTETHNQDKVSFGTIAARDAAAVLDLVLDVTSICLLAGAQAVDLRGVDLLPAPLASIHAEIRASSAMLIEDRRMAGDIASMRANLGGLSKLAQPADTAGGS